MLTALDLSAADERRGLVACPLGSEVAGTELRDLRGHLASTADVMGGRRDPGGLLYAADAAAGRLAARRRDLAA
jgi:hypothetical protein